MILKVKIRGRILSRKGGDAYGNRDTTPNLNPLNYDGRPITRSRAKRIKDAAKELMQKSLECMEQNKDKETKLINLLSCDPVDTHPCVHLHDHIACL